MIDEPPINFQVSGEERGFVAVILSGGTGARLGGLAKHEIEYAGRSLLDHALAAVAGAHEVVVVGPQTTPGDTPAAPTTSGSARPAPVTFVVEDPPRGGPAAGLLAGVGALSGSERPGAGSLLAVLAVDMPFVDAATFDRLRAALADDPTADGAFLTDGAGRRQLAGILRADRLAQPAHAQDAANLPMHRLLGDLRLLQVSGIGPESTDIDTPADLAALASGPSGRQAEVMELDDWIEQLRSALETDGDPNAEVDQALILDLARISAHSVERKSAPITTYLLGYAAGATGADGKRIAELAFRAQRLAEGWTSAHPSGSKEG